MTWSERCDRAIADIHPERKGDTVLRTEPVRYTDTIAESPGQNRSPTAGRRIKSQGNQIAAGGRSESRGGRPPGVTAQRPARPLETIGRKAWLSLHRGKGTSPGSERKRFARAVPSSRRTDQTPPRLFFGGARRGCHARALHFSGGKRSPHQPFGLNFSGPGFESSERATPNTASTYKSFSTRAVVFSTP